jgi:hypothetical protein
MTFAMTEDLEESDHFHANCHCQGWWFLIVFQIQKNGESQIPTRG